MIFSYNWLQGYLKEKLLKPKKLAEYFMMYSFEVEDIKKQGGDWALDVDIMPNRAPDCLSHIGLARELSAVFGLKFKKPNFRPKESKKLKTEDLIEVKVKSKKDCSRYTARVITDIKVGESSKLIKERLKTCGLKPINNIVDAANYVMLETGQPLHVFDLDKISDQKIIIRKAKKGEKITTLDNVNYKLNEKILVIADSKKPLAIAGIKGGKRAEIVKSTKRIVLEAANFNLKTIRQGSKDLCLKTDASWRFENSIDSNLTEVAINRAAEMIQSLTSGKVAKGLIDFYPKKPVVKKIWLELSRIESLLGIEIPKKDIFKILERLEFKILKDNGKKIQVQVPTFRLDVSIPENLIEEIGRIYGYEKIPAVAPKVCLIPAERNWSIFWENFSKDVLKENGFSELYSYSFINEEKREIFGYKSSEVLEVENPLSENQKYLSPSLIPNLMESVTENFKYFDKIKIFELGKIFYKKNKKSSIIEKSALTALIAQKTGKNTFYELKGVVDVLLEKMGISNYWYDDYMSTPEESRSSVWRQERCAEIKIGNKEIGFLGEVSKEILKTLKIKGKVGLIDIDFEELKNLATEEQEYSLISSFPSAIRDIAVLVPLEVRVIEVLNIINRVGGKLIKDIDLFDIYEGKEIASGKKNLAFHIIYQAEDRTLSSEEIDKVQNKIIKTLEEETSWETRR